MAFRCFLATSLAAAIVPAGLPCPAYPVRVVRESVRAAQIETRPQCGCHRGRRPGRRPARDDPPEPATAESPPRNSRLGRLCCMFMLLRRSRGSGFSRPGLDWS